MVKLDGDFIVPAVQWIRPHGRRMLGHIRVDTKEAVERMICLGSLGYELGLELIPGDLVNITIYDNEKDLVCDLCPNGSEVPTAVTKAIQTAWEKVQYNAN